MLAQKGLTGRAGVRTLECYVSYGVLQLCIINSLFPLVRDAFEACVACARRVRSRECYDVLPLCNKLPAELPPASLPPPCLMSIYSLILGRHILSKTPRSRLRFYSSIRATTSPRPYTFHIGASWAGKPDEALRKIRDAFPPDTIIGTWRDKTLSRPKAVRSRGAGEDFFFLQEVLLNPYNYVTLNSLLKK